MIRKEDILAVAHLLSRSGGKVRNRRAMHPTRDWLIVLSVSVCVFLAGSSYAGYEFYTLLRRADEPIVIESTVARYDQKLVEQVLTDYAGRKARFDDLRASVRPGAVVNDDAGDTTSSGGDK